MTINCADAITMITGRLCVSVDRLYSLYNEFLDEKLYTHQLPRAARYADPIVRTQLRELSNYLDTRSITGDNWQQEVNSAVWLFGDVFEVVTATEEWQRLHPLDEPILAGKKVIVVEPPEAL